jgi:hypothetical protein
VLLPGIITIAKMTLTHSGKPTLFKKVENVKKKKEKILVLENSVM